MDISAEIEMRRNELRRIAYNHYLRTGRVPLEIKSALGEDISGGYWVKFNPYHDPDNGRFTFAPGHPHAIGNQVVSERRNATKPHGLKPAAPVPSRKRSLGALSERQEAPRGGPG